MQKSDWTCLAVATNLGYNSDEEAPQVMPMDHRQLSSLSEQ